MICPRLSTILVCSGDLSYTVSSRAALACASWRRDTFGWDKTKGHMIRHVTGRQFSVASLFASKSFVRSHHTLPNLYRASYLGHDSNPMSTPVKESRPIVISGPSGVGKGTLIQKLFEEFPNTFAFTVSHTTRAPRAGEIDGKDYFFVTPSTFADLISQGAFVEHAKFGGNQYGTSQKTIADQTAKGLIVVLDIEMDGVRQIQANPNIKARYVFIKPPSFEVLEKRLRGRGTEKDESIQKRLAQARVELDYAETGVHDKIIVNDNLQEAYEELKKFVFDSN